MEKKFIQITLLILGMALFYGCTSLSKKSRHSAEAALNATKFEIKDDPRIVFGQLENGFRYALMKNAYPEKRVMTALNFDVGSAMEEEQERGLAHFLEHMAFRSLKHFPDGKIVEHMQKLGIAFGHDLNAHTSILNTCYEFDLPNANPETIDATLLAFRDFCDGINLLESDVNQERGVILSEKRDHDNIFMKLAKANLKFALKGTILPHRFPIGKEKVIENTSSSDLRRFYEKWYSPEKMFFAAVGNIDVKIFEKKIRQTFQDLPPRKIPLEANIGKLESQERQFFYFSDPDLSTTTVEISTIFPDQFPVDNYETRRHRATVAYIGDILKERLRDKKTENPSLFSSGEVSFAQNFFQTKHSIFDAEITCEYKNWSACLNLLEQEIRKMCQYGIGEDELQRQKEVALNCAERNMLAAETHHSLQLVKKLINSHNMHRKYMSPEDFYALTKTLNNDISAEDCRKTLCDIWKNLYISVQTNHSIADAYQTIENLFKSCEALPITPNKQEALEPFAYEHFETPYREIIEKNYIEDLGITQLTLKNGVTVNLKPTDFEQNQIQFSLTIGHGPLTNYPHPQPGIFLAATQVFLKSGLRKNSWKSLTKLLAAKCIQMNFDVDERCFRLFGTCDKKNLLCGLQLMTAYLSDAGFEERALLDARETLKPIYRDRAKSPSSVIADQYRKFITGNSIIAGLPEEQSVFSVTMEAIQKLLLPVFQNEAIELTLVGDFDLEMATKNIQDTLGAISIRSPTNNATLNAGILTFPGEVTEKLFHFTGDEKRALSMLTFLTNDENNIQDNRKLTVLAYLIGDRLRNKTRKEKGNTYSPIVDNNASAFKDFGLFEIILSLNPELIHDTKNETLRIIADLKTTPASQEELDRIKLPILNLIRDKFRQNSFWIDRTMHAHRRPQCLEDLRTMRSFYENISAQDLLQTAQKYLNNPIHSTITRENPLPQSAEKID